MSERYYLNGETLPIIPVPHDGVIKEMRIDGDELVFVFENDISGYDFAKYYMPGAKSLIMRFHMLEGLEDIRMTVQKKRMLNRLRHKSALYEDVDLYEDPDTLLGLCRGKVEYITHHVGCCSMIVRLWSAGSVTLEFGAKRVELEWIFE